MLQYYAIGFLIGIFCGSIVTGFFFKFRILQYQKMLIDTATENAQAKILLSVWKKVLDPNYGKGKK